MLRNFTRREWCRSSFHGVLAVGTGLLGTQRARRLPAAEKPARLTLGFSLYGMKGLSLDDAFRTCAELGYDDIEPALMPDFPADPQKLSKARRAELRRLLQSTGLGVSGLMENLRPVVSADAHAQTLDRLARAAELGHDPTPGATPVLETVLGGKPDEWPTLRQSMVEGLRDWAKVAEKHDLMIAVKPHVSGALHRPDDAVWLVEQVGSPNLKAAYDYSHYEAQGMKLDDTLTTLIGQTVFIHVKDNDPTSERTKFLLPGQGRVDYAAYFRRLVELGYNGSVTVEVSSSIHSQPSYDPRAAAESSYRALSAAWKAAGLPART